MNTEDREVNGMDGYTAKECKSCDGQGVLFGDNEEETECPACEGEGLEYNGQV